jgi:glycosyltransferase involved in cell wall biosynthesis
LDSIPVDLRWRFRFTGRVRRGRLGLFARQARIRFAILPSRYETFCLAAHEAAFFGLQLILPRLPAYEAFFVDENGEHAFMFNGGSVDDLARTVRLALEVEGGAGLAKQSATTINYPDPAKLYGPLIRISIL